MKPHLPIGLLAIFCGLVAAPAQTASAAGTVSVVNIFAQNTEETETSISEIVEYPIKSNIVLIEEEEELEEEEEEEIEESEDPGIEPEGPEVEVDLPKSEVDIDINGPKVDTADPDPSLTEEEETSDEPTPSSEEETVTTETPTPSPTPVVPETPLPTSATVNAPGTAQKDSLRSHIGSVRERLAGLGQSRPVTKQYWVQPQKGGKGGHYATMTATSDFQYHLWIEGTGSYSKLDEQNGRGGYTLSSRGGSVGAAATIDNNLTLGAAFSATWGDLSSSASHERATGDLDSLYLDLLAHYQSNAWGHTLILTGTTTDASLKRSGVANGTTINTHGDTDGYGLGALYELTYDIPLNEAGTSILQPLFDASIVTTSLDAYDETGTGALHVGKQEWTTGSVAVGARWLGSFGTETVGQTFFGSLRLAVSQDFGDTRGETTISQGALSSTAYGSKVGSTALQIGAGISTAITPSSTIFANVNADFRSRENSVNGAVGYRYSF